MKLVNLFISPFLLFLCALFPVARTPVVLRRKRFEARENDLQAEVEAMFDHTKCQ
jgi:hypothetical protein